GTSGHPTHGPDLSRISLHPACRPFIMSPSQSPHSSPWRWPMTRHAHCPSVRPHLEALEARELLSDCTVDRLTDLGQGAGSAGDLRYCLTQAQSGDHIAFGVTGTINLTRALPDLTRNVSIDGSGADQLTVRRDTGGNYRIFTVAAGANVSMTG